MSTNIQEKYNKEILPELKKEFGYKNDLMAPSIEKIVINVGFGSKSKEGKYQEAIQNTLTRITGQKPSLIPAKKSISNFKLREGMIVGAKVTLRKVKMYEFLDKLINITLPRVRDFRGVRTSIVDKSGNLNIGFKEHLVFPEISPDEIELVHGLQITISTTAKNTEEGYKLFELLGFPFNKELKKEKKKKSKTFGKKK